MKKTLGIFSILLFFLLVPVPARAQNVADQSAKVQLLEAKDLQSSRIAKKRLAISRVLGKRNSPLAGSVDEFIQTCVNFDLDCYLLPSITGLESSFGQFTHPGSHNPFGWGGGYIMFNNWGEAINTVGKGLRENYINRGAETVDQIAPIYAASQTWAPRVKSFMNAFEAEEAKIDYIMRQNVVEL